MRTHRPVRRAQQGPTIRRPVRSTREAASSPRKKTPAHSSTLSSQIRLTVQPGIKLPSSARHLRGMATAKDDTYESIVTAAPVGPAPGFFVWRLSLKWGVAVGRVIGPHGLTHDRYSLIALLAMGAALAAP